MLLFLKRVTLFLTFGKNVSKTFYFLKPLLKSKAVTANVCNTYYMVKVDHKWKTVKFYLNKNCQKQVDLFYNNKVFYKKW